MLAAVDVVMERWFGKIGNRFLLSRLACLHAVVFRHAGVIAADLMCFPRIDPTAPGNHAKLDTPILETQGAASYTDHIAVQVEEQIL